MALRQREYLCTRVASFCKGGGLWGYSPGSARFQEDVRGAADAKDVRVGNLQRFLGDLNDMSLAMEIFESVTGWTSHR